MKVARKCDDDDGCAPDPDANLKQNLMLLLLLVIFSKEHLQAASLAAKSCYSCQLGL